MPDWIIVLIILLIIAIVLDGLRRVRQHRKENIRLSKRVHLADKEIEGLDDENLNEHVSEFPSGGARKSQSSESTSTDDRHHTLTFDEPVPMLMESIAQEEQLDLAFEKGTDTRGTIEDLASDNRQERDAKKAAAQSSLGVLASSPGELANENISDNDLDPHATISIDSHNQNNAMPTSEPTLGSLDDLDGLDALDESDKVAKDTIKESDDKPAKDNPLSFKNYKPKLSKRAKEKPEPETHDNEPQEVVIVNVMAKNETLFEGQQLLQAFVDNNLKFGDRDIFHRHVKVNGDGAVLFSIANMVVPGTFDLVSIDSFVTPGVSMFMTLPVDEESLIAFNIMIDTAKNLANSLDGELKDENRSVMTAQTIEHAKEKVLEYERKRQLRHR